MPSAANSGGTDPIFAATVVVFPVLVAGKNRPGVRIHGNNEAFFPDQNTDKEEQLLQRTLPGGFAVCASNANTNTNTYAYA